MAELRRYTGPVPQNVSWDASYSVVGGPRDPRLQLRFRRDRKQHLLTPTDPHEELAAMVNHVKQHLRGGIPGGRFYINEFRFVLVPDGEGSAWYAGTYTPSLRFDFAGTVVQPEAPAGLEPGDQWPGPHMGVSYTLAPHDYDIRYRTVDRGRSGVVKLSDAVGFGAAAALVARLAQHTGQDGARIYINEAQEFFAKPPWSDEFIYLGPLSDDPWFPPPDGFCQA